MPAQTSITIQDGKPTPEDHVFVPLRAFNGTAEWAESSSDGSLTKRNQLTYTQKLPGKGRSTVLEQAEMVIPHVVTEVIGGVSREVVHSNIRAVVQIISHPEVPGQVVKDARVLMADLLTNAAVASAMDDRVGFS